jgi:DNA-binding response OmpR family regulator
MSQIQDPSSKEEHLTRKVLLIVEDDPGTATFLMMAIAQESPYLPLVAETGERALELVQHVKPALFILDYVLGTMNGLRLYDSLHAQQGLEAIPAIILSASVEQYQDEIEQRHLLGLAKPFELDELLLSIEQALSVPQEQR